MSRMSGPPHQSETARHQNPFEPLEATLHEQGQCRGRDGTLQNQPHVVKANAGEDGLPVATGADQGSERGGSDIAITPGR